MQSGLKRHAALAASQRDTPDADDAPTIAVYQWGTSSSSIERSFFFVFFIFQFSCVCAAPSSRSLSLSLPNDAVTHKGIYTTHTLESPDYVGELFFLSYIFSLSLSNVCVYTMRAARPSMQLCTLLYNTARAIERHQSFPRRATCNLSVNYIYIRRDTAR